MERAGEGLGQSRDFKVDPDQGQTSGPVDKAQHPEEALYRRDGGR